MIRFLYTGELNLKRPTPSSTKKDETGTVKPETAATLTSDDTSYEVLRATNLYIMGDYWQIGALKTAAATAFKTNPENGWNSVEFTTSLKYIFECTREEDGLLTDLAVEWAGRKAPELLDRGDFVEVCKENAALSFEVMKAAVECRKQSTVSAQRKRCPFNPLGHTYVSLSTRSDAKYFCAKCRRPFN